MFTKRQDEQQRKKSTVHVVFPEQSGVLRILFELVNTVQIEFGFYHHYLTGLSRCLQWDLFNLSVFLELAVTCRKLGHSVRSLDECLFPKARD